MPNVSNVRQEATKFVEYVLNNNGDLKLSIEGELKSVRAQLADLMARMNTSRDEDEIRRLRAPISIAVTLVPYLEQLLDLSETKTAGEFTAETLESEAAKMPPSKKAEADILRQAAQIYRQVGGTQKVRVWKLPENE